MLTIQPVTTRGIAKQSRLTSRRMKAKAQAAAYILDEEFSLSEAMNLFVLEGFSNDQTESLD